MIRKLAWCRFNVKHEVAGTTAYGDRLALFVLLLPFEAFDNSGSRLDI